MKCNASLFALLVFVSLGAGCTPTIETRGFNAENVQFSQIKPGIHSKQQVQEILGSPSTIPSFDTNVWYYVSKKTSTTSFFEPTVLDQQVTVITFTTGGIVSDVKTYKGEEAKNIKPVERKTETTGYETGVLREVFSNFGRMSSKKPTKPG
ncbi:MAG: outer membrane protein assembly factor BamE [Alphaproteobacteria bacterium]|jgi:outer membrane protein assembly factor BamE (lipoprotein component of BamABCDE complex)|nr:outer membrane protein assembly factor BamE [Alphaproteobacteria bacterium]